jgi:autotransporter-associated beta strand protein
MSKTRVRLAIGTAVASIYVFADAAALADVAEFTYYPSYPGVNNSWKVTSNWSQNNPNFDSPYDYLQVAGNTPDVRYVANPANDDPETPRVNEDNSARAALNYSFSDVTPWAVRRLQLEFFRTTHAFYQNTATSSDWGLLQFRPGVTATGAVLQPELVVKAGGSEAAGSVLFTGSSSSFGRVRIDVDGTLKVDLEPAKQFILGAKLADAEGKVGKLTKAGAGVLRVGQLGTFATEAANSSYSGGTELQAGGIMLQASSTPGGPGAVANGPLGKGVVTLIGGQLSSDNSIRTLHNTVSIKGNIELGRSTNYGVILAGVVDLGGGSRTVTVTSNSQITGNIVDGGGSADLIKSGPGVLRLAGTNTFTGQLNASQGVLLAASQSIFGSSTNLTRVESQASLTFESGQSYLISENISIGGHGTDPSLYNAVSVPSGTNVSSSGQLQVRADSSISVGKNGVFRVSSVKNKSTGLKNLYAVGKGKFIVDNPYVGPAKTMVKIRGNAALNGGSLNSSIEVPVTDVNDVEFEFDTPITLPDPADTDPPMTFSTLEFMSGGGYPTSINTGVAGVPARLDTQAYSPVISGAIDGAGDLTKVGTGSISAQYVRSGSVSIMEGSLVVRPNAGDTGVSRVGNISVAGGATPAAKLDLSDNDFVVDYDTTSPYQVVQSLLVAGYGSNKDWTGNGITSSTAAIPANLGMLGIAEASAIGVTTFSGQTVDSTTVLVKYTYRGDANLNGLTNFDDLLIVAANYNLTGKVWTEGDGNYDGAVNFDDLLLQASAYNLTPGRSSQLGGAEAVYLELKAGAPWILAEAAALYPDQYAAVFGPYDDGTPRSLPYGTRLQNYKLPAPNWWLTGGPVPVPEPTVALLIGAVAVPVLTRRRRA